MKMIFDPNNKVMQLCCQGMELEGQGRPKEALQVFQQAWNEAANDVEKFTSAHYLARHQEHIQDKLQWDKTALHLALQIDGALVKAAYPSLFLNVAKCYEDLKDFDNARKYYKQALSFINELPDDGYGNMIKSGILNGLDRTS